MKVWCHITTLTAVGRGSAERRKGADGSCTETASWAGWTGRVNKERKTWAGATRESACDGQFCWRNNVGVDDGLLLFQERLEFAHECREHQEKQRSEFTHPHPSPILTSMAYFALASLPLIHACNTGTKRMSSTFPAVSDLSQSLPQPLRLSSNRQDHHKQKKAAEKSQQQSHRQVKVLFLMWVHWCSGYHVCRRSWVQSPDEPLFFSFCLGWTVITWRKRIFRCYTTPELSDAHKPLQ